MGTKMKGLLKGLRYISQIFETNEKEREMEIGYPTDVKHVAHIGWDGPSVNNPSWMSEYRSVPEFSSAPLTPTGTEMDPVLGPKSASQDLQRLMESENSVEVAPRQTRRHRLSGGGPVEPDSPEFLKPSRRRPSIGEPSDLTSQDQLPKPLKPSRRRANHGSGSLDSPTRDSPAVPRQSRRRQSKGSSGSVGGSTSKPTRSRASLTTAEEDEPAKAAEGNEPAS
ncbi:CRIB domain-containing protein [Nymphaea thermarum]|nr:CRIB domain-containing protein [Nymphaea thermarum]